MPRRVLDELVVSVLFNEPKLLKSRRFGASVWDEQRVSVLFNEPKLLKLVGYERNRSTDRSFSALQRAEIAEILNISSLPSFSTCFSALQRAEIAEIHPSPHSTRVQFEFQCSSTSRNC